MWGAILLKGNGGAYKGWLSRDGNSGDSVKANASFIARKTFALLRKQSLVTRHHLVVRVEISDKSYSRDNRLVKPESSH